MLLDSVSILSLLCLYSANIIGYPGALFSPTCVTNEYVNVQADHAVVAHNISREAITLLKNDDSTLPLSVSTALRIFGQDAQNNPNGINSCNDKACDTGVLGMGWGSGKIASIYCMNTTYSCFKALQIIHIWMPQLTLSNARLPMSCIILVTHFLPA
jgi:hypothetical protein